MTMSLIAGVAAFVLTVLAMPHFITYYKIKKIGGQQMHEDVKQHLAKAGTPTMGGTVFLVVAILVSLIFNFNIFSRINAIFISGKFNRKITGNDYITFNG